MGALPKSELLETVVTLCDGEVTTTDVRKAAGLLLKAGIMEVRGANDESEVMWQVSPLSESEVLYAVDRAMMVRLLAGLEDTRSPLEKSHLAPLCLGKHSSPEIDALLKEASELGRNGSGQD
jgi:hypothetical protein